MSSLLLERIANATNADDLLPIFKAAPIDILRDAANMVVDRITQNETKSIKFKSCSLHKIIGNDITQKILSFIPYYTPAKSVDKTFKALNDKNAEMRLTQTNKLINNENFETNFEKNVEAIFNLDNNNHNNDILNNIKQILLTERKMSSLYIDNKEVYNSFDDIFEQNEFLNKIIVFVEDGEYELLFAENYFYETIVIIGIGENARINLETDSCDKDFRFNCNNIYIQNITIISSDNDLHIYPTEKINLWMKNTVIKHIGIFIEDANFYAKKCRFMSGNTANETVFRWLDVGYPRNFDVLGCTFNVPSDCINSFIEIEANEKIFAIPENAGNIRIIGNIFNGKCLRSTITAIHPADHYWYRHFTSSEQQDWNEQMIKIYFSAHLTIAYNFIVGSGNSYINPNQFKTKKLKPLISIIV